MLETEHTLLPLAALNWDSSWFAYFWILLMLLFFFLKNSLFILFNITAPLIIFSSPRVGWLTHSICLFPQCDADERGPHHFLSAFITLPLHALSQFMFLIAKVQTDPKRYEFICWGIERRKRKSIKNIKYYLPHSNLNVLFYRVEDWKHWLVLRKKWYHTDPFFVHCLSA